MAHSKEKLPPGIAKRQTKRRTVWDVRVYVGYPNQPYLYKTFRTEGAAKSWKREQESRKNKGDCPSSDRRSVGEYLADWLKLKAEGAVVDRHMRKRAIGPRTLDDYRRLADDWIIKPSVRRKGLHRIGHLRIDAITYRTLNALYDSMREFTTVGTIKKLNRFLGQAFVELEQKGVLGRNPADFTNVPQVDAQSDDEADENDLSAQAMEAAEAESFLRAAREIADEQERQQDRDYQVPERCWSALWHVLLGAGLRPGEAFGLRWTAVDLNDLRPIINVERNLVRVRGVKGYRLAKPKTKRSKRAVPLLPSVVAELKHWRTMQKRQRLNAGRGWQDLGFVFTTSLGTPLHGARRSFERVSAAAGLGDWGAEPKREHITGPVKARDFIPSFRFYDLRHTFITNALARGIPVNVVADWVGHDDPGFTYSRYGHALKKDTQQAVMTMEGVLFGSA